MKTHEKHKTSDIKLNKSSLRKINDCLIMYIYSYLERWYCQDGVNPIVKKNSSLARERASLLKACDDNVVTLLILQKNYLHGLILNLSKS